jgi:RNA-directed DNA polymerase
MFNKIINLENLFLAWSEFKRSKTSKPDVAEFELKLEQNIIQLHHDLRKGVYQHSPYKGFYITDPKVRHVHKAVVRDRVLHHAIFNTLNPPFEKSFINNSFSCQIGKGSHKGVETVQKILRKVSRNNTVPCYALKCDVKKFFDSINHNILLEILGRKIKEERTFSLITELIHSYPKKAESEREREREREREFLPILAYQLEI